MKYKNCGKTYDVESVELNGAIINVNGTSITDCELMGKMTSNPFMKDMRCYTVFCDSDEICFDTFDEAYVFATTKQKDTFRLED